MSVYHNTNPYTKFTYHQTDLDKTIPNSIEKERFLQNTLNHSMSRKGGFSTPIPVYKYDIVKGVKRFGDERDREKINRRHKAFLSSHSDFYKERPYN